MKDGEGCTIDFFVKCQQVLADTYGDRVAEVDKLHDIVELLGKVEQIYLSMERQKDWSD